MGRREKKWYPFYFDNIAEWKSEQNEQKMESLMIESTEKLFEFDEIEGKKR